MKVLKMGKEDIFPKKEEAKEGVAPAEQKAA
jgi:hypothetical protein